MPHKFHITCHVIKRALRTRVLGGLLRIERAVVARRAHVGPEVGRVGVAVVARWAVCAVVLGHQVLIRGLRIKINVLNTKCRVKQGVCLQWVVWLLLLSLY